MLQITCPQSAIAVSDQGLANLAETFKCDFRKYILKVGKDIWLNFSEKLSFSVSSRTFCLLDHQTDANSD